MSLLKVQRLSKHFGGLKANEDISFSLEKGELLGLIGPNGAGKTTLFNCICGYHAVTSGRIIFDGEDITPLKAYEVARRGLARTFQVYVASGDLNVEENVMVGCFMRTRSRNLAQGKARQILRDLKLEGLSKSLVSELPVAAQKRVAMATALATEPKLLLLDEPSLGLAPLMVDEVFETIRRLKEQGITILLVEQNVQEALELADRGYVLQTGRVVTEGTAKELLESDMFRSAFLGI